MTYFTLKTIHIVFVTMIFGSGMAIVFFKLMADRTGDPRIVAATMEHVVIADLVFTLTAVIGLPLTGLAMLGWTIPFPWVHTAFKLYALAGIPWVVAVKLQYDMRRLAREAVAEEKPLGPSYWLRTKIWAALGLPSFTFAVLLIFLMVNRRLPWEGA